MLNPQKLLDLNASVGYLVLNTLNPDSPDSEGVFNDFRRCLNRDDPWAERFWTGYRATPFPNVSSDHIKALYASYQGIISELEGRLRSQWTCEFQPHWATLSQAGSLQRWGALQPADRQGVENALLDVWDDIQQLPHLLADLQANSETLLEYLTHTDLQALLDAPAEAIANALRVLGDEPLLFIYLSAISAWLRMLPPQYVAEVFAEIRAGVLIGLLLGCVTGAMGLGAGLGAKWLARISSPRARKWLGGLSEQMVHVSSSQGFNRHAEALKPLMLKAPILQANKPCDTPRPVTRLSQLEQRDNAPVQAKNPNGDTADKASRTATNGCPVSMVTGEELLTLTDAKLDGWLPFSFTRLYRSSAVELDSGLGFGWSHSLSQRLEINGGDVIWIDPENRRTPFPMPCAERPVIHNSLSRAAIYLGADADELILAQSGDGAPFYHFHDGQLTAISDAYDNRLSISRDLSGRIKRLDNGAGRALLLRYDRRHLVAIDYQVCHCADSLADAWQTEQTLASYRYDERNQLIEAGNGVGESERYDYDDQHVIVQRQLAGGASFFWEWERQGKAARCVRHWASFAQMDTRYVWDDNGSVSVQYVDGSEEVYVHDTRARLVRRTEANGAEHLKAYDDNGQLIAEQDALGGVTQYRYNEVGRLLAIIPAEGEPTYYEYYNGFVRLMCRGEARWKYRRNPQGDLTEQVDPDGHSTHYRRDAKGRLLAICYPDHSQHTFTWNTFGQLTEEQLPDGALRRFTYDALGRQIRRQDEHGAVTEQQWDAVGRLLKTTLPGGATRAFTYNAYGKVTRETDELGQVTRYEYDDDLHLISRRINPDGSQLRYRYDNARLLLSEIENEAGETYRLAYGANGLIQQATGFDGRRTAYRYDLRGHLLEKTEFGDDGSTLITAYQRDAVGRLRVKTLPDGTKVEYRYDTLGRLVGVDDGGGWPLAFAYDRQDRLITEHQGWGTLHYGYSTAGDLTHLRLPDNSSIDFHHAPGGTLTGIDLNGARLTRHVFEAGRERQRQQGHLLSQYHYDEQGRLQVHALNQPNRPSYMRHYAYGVNGNLASIADSRHGQRTYYYDALNRLTRVRHARRHEQESFSHDPTGNLQLHDSPGLATHKGNRLLRQDDCQYDYDAFGNLIRERRGTTHKRVTEYRYDCQHRLIGLTLPDGSTAGYRYDAFGRRTAKTVAGLTTEFFWQGERLVAENSRHHHRSYVFEPGSFRPLALLDGFGPSKACPFYYQLDHLGTPQELTDYSGEIIWSATYTAYGKLTDLKHLAGEQCLQPLRLPGHYFDPESGLHYNRHRYYNPHIGRYLTPGPSQLAGGLNVYRYTVNPTGWVAPLGLNTCPGGDECQPVNDPQDPAAKVGVDEGEPATPTVRAGTWSRKPKRIQDQLAFTAVHSGEGNVITRDLNDPLFKPMDKMELKVK